jgi:hypothetical protein
MANKHPLISSGIRVKLETARIARLATLDTERRPHAVPQLALLVDQYDEDWTRLWYVLVRGEAVLVSASAEHQRAIQRLRAKYPQYDADMLADDVPILPPHRITAWGKI